MNTSHPEPETDSKSGALRPGISISILVDAFKNAWRRFPVTVIFIALSALWLIVLNHCFYIEHYFKPVALTYFTMVGVLLTFAVNIWCEFTGYSKKIPITVAILLLLADSLYINFFEPDFNTTWGLSRFALNTALVVAILFFPTKKKWAWNYTFMQFNNLGICIIYGIVCLIATGIITATIAYLFSVSTYDFSIDLIILFCYALPVVMFVARTPDRSAPEDMEETFEASRFMVGSVKYFLLPLTVIYMAILYVYGITILLNWELPHGIVCWSVTGLTAAVFVTGFFLEGVRRTYPDDTLALKALRYLPMAMFPMLVLMSVAVLYRIGQYGLTVSRLYVLTFNIWAYCMMIYWIIRRPRTFNFAAISFAIVFVATSIIPYANYMTITDNIMRNRLLKELKTAGLEEFPVDRDEFIKAYSTLDLKQRKDVTSILEYLGEDEGRKIVTISQDAYYFSFLYNLPDDEDDDIYNMRFSPNFYINRGHLISIPEGYRYVISTSSDYELPKDFDQSAPCVVIDKVKFSIPIDSIASLPEDSFIPVTLLPVSGSTDSIYVATKIEISYNRNESEKADKPVYDRIGTSGLLFTK